MPSVQQNPPSYLHRHGPNSGFSFRQSSITPIDASPLRSWTLCRRSQAWNYLIRAHLQRGDLRYALFLYSRMREEAAAPMDSVASALLTACAKLKDAETGRQIHAQIDGSEMLESNPLVGTALMDMYAKCGMMDRAEHVFDRIRNHDVVTWNALIAGYGLHDRSREALQCFEHMRCRGVIPDEATFACTLKACGALGASSGMAKGQDMHAEIEASGMLERSQNVGNALIDMYNKCGSLERAEEAFSFLPTRDTISWNASISGLVQHGQAEEALDRFAKMQLEGVSGDDVTYACILKACGCVRSPSKGGEMHSDAEKKGLSRTSWLVGNVLVDMYAKCGMLTEAKAVFEKLPECDTVAWNALMSGYVHCDREEEALDAFEQMQRRRIAPNSVTFACSLKACGSIGAIEKGRAIHAKIEGMGMLKKRSQVVGNALVDLYAKCGIVAKALEVFGMLPVRNVVSWNVLLTGHGQAGEIEDVLSVFDQMRKNGIEPNAVTFLVVLNACSHTGMIDEARTCYCEAVMTGNRAKFPLMGHLICMIDLLSRAGQLEEALELVTRAPLHPNAVMWLTMLGACRNWRNVELGQRAFEEMVRLDRSDITAYVSMYNIYAETDVLA